MTNRLCHCLAQQNPTKTRPKPPPQKQPQKEAKKVPPELSLEPFISLKLTQFAPKNGWFPSSESPNFPGNLYFQGLLLLVSREGKIPQNLRQNHGSSHNQREAEPPRGHGLTNLNGPMGFLLFCCCRFFVWIHQKLNGTLPTDP